MVATRYSALFLAVLLAAPAVAQTPTNRWDNEIAAFEAADRLDPPPKGAIVFIGSSSIRLWKTLARDFPEHRVLNRGFGGSFISDAVHFAERIVVPYEPRLIVLYAGGNDLNAGRTAGQVFNDFKAFVEIVHARLPGTRMAYISIAPNPARWAQVEEMRTVNNLIASFTEQHAKLEFIDVFPHMLGEDGKPKPAIFQADKLHLNAQGYELWKAIIGAYLPGKTALRVFPSPHRTRGPRSNPEVYDELFRLNGKFAQTAVKVFRVAELAANTNAAPVWHLLPNPKSMPRSTLFYGQSIQGMNPSLPWKPAAPLKASELYRIVVEAGGLIGQADFKPVPVDPAEPL